MKNQNDQQHDGESEGTPLLQQQRRRRRKQKQHPQQEAENFNYNNVYPQPMPPQMAMNPNLNLNMNMNLSGNNPNSMAVFAALAAQYEQAGYNASDAAAAVASMAVYQQQQQQLYMAASAFGYPPPAQAQMYYSSQPQQYQGIPVPTNLSSAGAPVASPLSPQAAATASRPPRSSRRASSPMLAEIGNGNRSLPPLQDIFGNNNNDSITTGNSANNNSDYGSIAQTNSPIWSAPSVSATPNNYASGGVNRVKPALIRTSSSGAIHCMSNSPKQTGRRGHRRSSSDMPINSHRRTVSAEAPLVLPPIAGGSGHRRTGSFGGFIGAGSSVISGGNRPRATTSGSNPHPRRGSAHRRSASSGSVGTFASQVSTTSVRSNIVKSSMFGGFDAHTGQVQMHFPFEAVRLVFVDDEQDPNLSNQKKRTKQQPPVDPHSMLTQGHLYLEGRASDYEDFEDYTEITNAMEEGLTRQWETLDRLPTNDNNNLSLNSILKPPSYLLPVSAKVYKRMVGEISDAHYMPCGLFFCGHHEDVAHPSIAIALFIVILLFSFMAYVAFFIEGS